MLAVVIVVFKYSEYIFIYFREKICDFSYIVYILNNHKMKTNLLQIIVKYTLNLYSI